MDLSRKRDRERLKVQHNLYVQRLAKGCYLGFRRGPDTWAARFRDKQGVQHFKTLDGISDYDQAKAAADEWFSTMGSAPVRRVKRNGTVRAALEAYLADLTAQGRTGPAKEVAGRFKTIIYDHKIAQAMLETVTMDDFAEWRASLIPGRQPRTVNRHVRAVTAALNKAVTLGHIGNRLAWEFEALQDDTEEQGDSAVMLAPAHRKALIAAAEQHAAAFFRGLELTGARPKELASATVRDFDGAAVRLASRKGKNSKLRVRLTVLSDDGAKFFTQMTRDRPSSAPIFTEDGSTPWRRHTWSLRFRAAAVKVNEDAEAQVRIPVDASCYSFRHARISELLQLHGVDPLTVASQTGTSVAMIELAYLKFIPEAFALKLKSIQEP